MKAKVEQLEDENKNLEAGLKEVMEAMKKYGAGAPEGEGMEKGEREAMMGAIQFPTLERMLAVSNIKGYNAICNRNTFKDKDLIKANILVQTLFRLVNY